MKDDEVIFRKNLGARIRQLRMQKGLQQTELAAKLDGKDKQFIGRYEKEGANPKAYILYQLSKALGVSFDELLDFTRLPSQEGNS